MLGWPIGCADCAAGPGSEMPITAKRSLAGRRPSLAWLPVLCSVTACVDAASLRWNQREAVRAFNAGAYERARDRARFVLDADKHDENAADVYAAALLKLRGPAAALDQLRDEAAKNDERPNRVYAYVLARYSSAGEARRQPKLATELERVIGLAVARHPTYAPTLRLWASMALVRGDAASARARLLDALESNPSYVVGARSLIALCHGRGEIRELLEIRKKAGAATRASLRAGALLFALEWLRQAKPIEKRGDLPKLMQHYRRGMFTVDAAGGPCLGALVALDAARALLRLGRPKDAHRLAERAVPRCERAGDDPLVGTRLVDLAGFRKLAGDFRGSIEALDRAEQLARANSNDTLLAKVLHSKALDCINAASWTCAEESARQLIGLARKRDDLALESRGHADLGSACAARGLYDCGVRHFERALAILERLNDPAALASALSDLGRVLSSRGDHDRAIAALERALRLRAGDEGDEAATLVNLGAAYRARGDHVKALPLYRRAAELFSRMPAMRRFEAIAVANIGNVYRSLGLHAKALEYDERALRLKRGVANARELGESLYSLAMTLDYLGKKRQAMERAKEAIATFERAGAKLKGSAVEVFLASILGPKDAAEAERLIDKAIATQEAMRDRVLLSESLFSRAVRRVMRGDRAGAEADLARVEALDQEVGKPRWAAPYLRARMVAGADPRRARDHFAEAARRLDAARGALRSDEFKASFLASRTFVYHDLARASVELAKSTTDRKAEEDAFEAIERGKARSLLDQLDADGTVDAGARTKTERALLRKEWALIARATRLQKRIAALSSVDDAAQRERRTAALEATRKRVLEELDLLRAEIQAANPLLALTRSRAVSLTRVQRELLSSSSALLAYSVGERDTLLLVVTRERVAHHVLPVGRDSLAALVRAYREEFLLKSEIRRVKGYLRAGRQIHDLLLGVVDKGLLAGRDLIIVPDGPLAYLPFETLMVAVDAERRRPTYLVERHAVSYTPSASVLAALVDRGRRRPAAHRGFLGVGDPVYDMAAFRAGKTESAVDAVDRGRRQRTRAMLERLPATAREVERIAKEVTGPHDVLLRDAAREERLKAGRLTRRRILHFATHGILSDNFQALALTLDPMSREDGFFELREIRRLRVNAEVVTLSACQTGEGRLVSGEGIVGLTQAFLFAGAARTVVSLWKVADESTADLMVHMYAALGPPGAPALAHALRKAKLALRSKPSTELPYYWAPFVAIGLP
jgi:CHAT domain-containing protein/tetratricopeptide (TPR) repeat protein